MTHWRWPSESAAERRCRRLRFWAGALLLTLVLGGLFGLPGCEWLRGALPRIGRDAG